VGTRADAGARKPFEHFIVRVRPVPGTSRKAVAAVEMLRIEVQADGGVVLRAVAASGTVTSETWHRDLGGAHAEAELEHGVPAGAWHVDARREAATLARELLEGRIERSRWAAANPAR
jgi:hypothetical protein